LRAAHSLLLRLEPRPARNWSGVTADFVRPDVIIRKERGGRWVAALNPAIVPRVRINAVYEALLSQSRASPEMHSQLQQAQGVVKSVHQRFVTIQKVAQAVVDQQTAYFEKGVSAMRPMVLRD